MKTTIIVLATLFLFACDQGPKSPRGFSLPEGNMKQGYQVFKKYQCQDCHRIAGDKEPEDAQYLVAKPIPLGGSSGRIKTYAELVTSIINPSHKLTPRQPASFTSEDGVSLMRVVNDELTVSELIDLVAYLQPKYKVAPYRTSDYRLYQLRIPEKSNE
ncbi:c-type cytochrome [Alteromonas macleodii]|uniref:Cytochrome c family protein n=1 Tax=Alteromonas macleodii TaxID=28108 RepID=A0A6T9Y1B0_ALTMA|nr:c-type cytochrome [Alteromonas macleodii]CAB9494064.1 Cytochrome c family protein [Alteromonas macleodii]